MRVKPHVVRVLLRAYPARWRSEYGAELAALLMARPLTAAAVADVLRGATAQHLRLDEPWQICAGILLPSAIAGMVWNTLRPFSPQAYDLFGYGTLGVVFASGFWATLRGPNGIRAACWGAAKASIAAAIPDLTLCALWGLGILQITILTTSGLPAPDSGRAVVYGQIAPLYLRCDVRPSPLTMFSVTILVMGLEGAIIGGVGAFFGRVSRRFSSPVRPA